MPTPPSPKRLFTRPSKRQAKEVAAALRSETIGGLLLLGGAVVALVWANSAWRDGYAAFTGFKIGPAALHLHLSLTKWASDGLLAIFFFVVGLELKRELVDGDLRSPSRAALPIVAAVGGMVVPALVYLAVNFFSSSGTPDGWAIPMTTDIAFAMAVLAVISTHLPSGLRSFLLTQTVMDDLLAMIVIAVLFTDHLRLLPLLGAFALIALFGLLSRHRITHWWLLLPLGLVAWVLMHASGVHATVAGVLLGFAVPAVARKGERVSISEHFEHRWRPVSAGVAVPLFALVSAGVALTGTGIRDTVTSPVGLGVGLGLLIGKPIGVFFFTYLLARLTRATLDEELSWWDVLGIGLLGGIGFTVSLLLGELSFSAGSKEETHVKTAILLGSLASALFATVVLRWRNRVYRRLYALESMDTDDDDLSEDGS